MIVTFVVKFPVAVIDFTFFALSVASHNSLLAFGSENRRKTLRVL